MYSILVVALMLAAGFAEAAVIEHQNFENASAVAAPAANTTDDGEEGWKTDYRIPQDTLPVRYQIYLYPYMDGGLFIGKVYIHINVTKARSYLVTHTKNQLIARSGLYCGFMTMDDPTTEPKSDPITKTKSFLHPENEFLVMTKEGGFDPGLYTWYIAFSGSLTNGIVGFYRSVYKTSEGVERLMATSKFQPTYARRAFPCFDEPTFKSTFRVMLVRPTGDNYRALSNMPIEKEVPAKPAFNTTIVHFKDSVNMVTYLACFIVCDFDYTESFTNDGIPFRVYARPEQKSATQYSLDLGVKVSNFYVEYFQVPYPLPKQDMIAIPDFVSGAMEHWGLITFREVNLLYNDKTSSAANKQRVATVVAHELAHMWFGNLVTLKWWDDLWLNEGFASYMEYKGVDPFEPRWDITTQFITEDLVSVMDLDAQLSSHPIVQAVHHPDEITQLFDKISYNKGAAILRMLEHFLSEDVFRAGVSAFLKKFAFTNAVTQDLWDALQSVWTSNDGHNVSEIMDTWTKQMGYPLITVNQTNEGFEISQSRFLADPNAEPKDDSPFQYTWDVPISYRYWTGGKWEEGRTLFLRSQDNGKISLPGGGADGLKVNNDFKGYFVVNYETDVWAKISAELASPDGRQKWTSAADRANLFSDAFRLAKAGKISYSIPLELSKSLKLETHGVPWQVAYSELAFVRDMLSSTEISDSYQNFLKTISAPPYDEKYGFEDPGNDDVLGVQVQNRVIQLTCSTKHEPCVSEAERHFKEWLHNGGSLSPNLRGLIIKYGMTEELGTGDNWQKMFERYLNEGEPQERISLLDGLAATPNKEQLAKYIELAKDPKNVRRQDFFRVIASISRNPAGTDIAWDFYRNEWESFLVPNFTLNDRYLGNLIKSLTARFATEERKKEMEDIFAKYPEAGAGTAARKAALETVKNNIQWMQRSVDDIKNWFTTAEL